MPIVHTDDPAYRIARALDALDLANKVVKLTAELGEAKARIAELSKLNATLFPVARTDVSEFEVFPRFVEIAPDVWVNPEHVVTVEASRAGGAIVTDVNCDALSTDTPVAEVIAKLRGEA